MSLMTCHVRFILFSKYRKIRFCIGVTSVLFDDAMGFLEKLFLRVGQPPIGQIAI